MKLRRARTVLLCTCALLSTACASNGEKLDSTMDPVGDGDKTMSGDGDHGTSGDGDHATQSDAGHPTGDGDGDGDGDTTGGFATVDCTGDKPAMLDDLVTDFEDGTVGVNPVEGRGGGFYIFNDQMNDAKAQTFAVAPVKRCKDGTSSYAFCTKGSGFKVWGAGFGTDLGVVDADTMKKSAVDLGAYKGISFWIAGKPDSKAPTVKVMLPDVNTAEEGGHCSNSSTETTEKCDPFVKNVPVGTSWTKVEVLFADMRQGGWGKRVPMFSKEGVYGIQLQFAASVSFDVCFDQLVLLR